jgi:hypothetical protein
LHFDAGALELALAPRLDNAGQQQPHQQRDDRHDQQEFDQREGGVLLL